MLQLGLQTISYSVCNQQSVCLHVQMHPAAPLSSLQFQVRPRKLPPIQSIQLSGSPQSSAESLQHILQTAEAQSHQGMSSVTALMKAHDSIQARLHEQGCRHVKVAFDGVDTGKISATITEVQAADEASITGLEDSATSGKGWGIHPFQPRSQQVPSLHRAESSSITGASQLACCCAQSHRLFQTSSGTCRSSTCFLKDAARALMTCDRDSLAEQDTTNLTPGLFQAPRQSDAQLWHEANFTPTSSVTIEVICTEPLCISGSNFMLCL